MSIKVVGFDADDTLWVNENYFREAEKSFVELLKDYGSENEIMKLLYETEMKNLPIYGFGVKGFVLSMTETAVKASNGQVLTNLINQIIDIGKDMLNKPVQLLNGVEEVLKKVAIKYKVILVTKGDLLDQQRKLEKSGLEKYFHHIEIMSNKQEKDYKKLINHLDIESEEFLMVGNSLKSDILPVTNIGGNAIYVPYEITWLHEEVSEEELNTDKFHQVDKLHDVLNYIL